MAGSRAITMISYSAFGQGGAHAHASNKMIDYGTRKGKQYFLLAHVLVLLGCRRFFQLSLLSKIDSTPVLLVRVRFS